MDRFDLRLDVPAVPFSDLDVPARGESSATIAARHRQQARFGENGPARSNIDASGALLEEIAAPDAEGRALLARVADRFGLNTRGYHRILRVARTIADLDAAERVGSAHLAEAVSFRRAAAPRE